MPPNDSPTPHALDRTMLVAGLLQLAAVLTPAARVRMYGPVSFLRLPTAGVVLAVLGALTVAVALRPRGWWRWVPGVLSAAVLGVAYWRLSRAPSGSFIDPLLRHALHPSWGFAPMGVAVLLTFIGAARVSRRRTPNGAVIP